MLLLIKTVNRKKYIDIVRMTAKYYKRSIQNKIAFIKSLMAKILIVEYNPNDMAVVVAREFEEQ